MTEDMRQGQSYFWTGIREEGNVFVDDVSGIPINWSPNIWPGPVVSLDTSIPDGDKVCLFARGGRTDISGSGYYLVRQSCSSHIPCGICKVKLSNPPARLMLKGLCEFCKMWSPHFLILIIIKYISHSCFSLFSTNQAQGRINHKSISFSFFFSSWTGI